jgi:hypothetical protein
MHTDVLQKKVQIKKINYLIRICNFYKPDLYSEYQKSNDFVLNHIKDSD